MGGQAMQTFKEKLIKLGEENGLGQREAEQIVEAMITEDNERCKTMAGRWDDDADGYPPQMIAVLWMSFKFTADKWLAEHKPKHWARPMFASND
jgi:hypothetical protein